MPATSTLLFLAGQVTQGSADAFAESEITTGLGTNFGIAYRIKRIQARAPALIGADNEVTVCINRKSTSSNLSFASKANIAKFERNVELTTSGMVVQDLYWDQRWSDEDNLLIVEDPVYLTIDSTSTALANTAQCKIWYQQISIKELDRLAIIANYATA